MAQVRASRQKKQSKYASSQVHFEYPPICPIAQLNKVFDEPDKGHISWDVLVNSQDKYRGAWINMASRLEDVLTDNPLAHRLLEKSGWMGLMQIKFKLSSKLLTSCLIERWWDTTHTFQLPGFEIGLTPLDFTFLTGISIGFGEVPPYDENLEDIWANIRDDHFAALPVVPKESTVPCTSGGIKVSVLNEMIRAWPKHAVELRRNESAQCCIYRAFVLWMIGNVFFPNASSVVRYGWLKLFHSSSKALEDYDWGSAILGRIYHCMDACSRNTGEGSFDGMWMLLEHWFFMYFKRCEPKLKVVEDPWPRLRLWRSSNIGSKVNDAVIGRLQLEFRTNDVVLWDVIRMSNHECRSDVVDAAAITKTRRLLWDPEAHIGYWYLGDRCWRQAMDVVAIPANPIPKEYMLGAAWNVYERIRDAGWENARRWVIPCEQSDYNSYWRRVSRGHIEPMIYSKDDVDHIGGSAIPNPHVYLHHPHSDDVSHDSMDYTQQATQPPNTSYSRWRALCITHDLSGYEFVDVPQPTGDVDREIEMEAQIERTKDEWKMLYIDSLKALKQRDVLHNQRYYEAHRHRDFTGVASSESRQQFGEFITTFWGPKLEPLTSPPS